MMSFRILLTALLLFRVSALNLEDSKEFPVSKVVMLLKDMKAQLENEAKTDEEVYDDVACWCETNDKHSTAAIAMGEQKITDLTGEIQEHAADSARLKVEIGADEKALAKNEASLEKATALREKAAKEFTAEEKELLSCIAALKDAIKVLSKHHTAALNSNTASLRPSDVSLPTSMNEVLDTIRHQMSKHPEIVMRSLTSSQRRVVSSLMQAPTFLSQPADYFDAEPTFSQSYAPQSGQIFGILKQLKEDFETSLSESTKEELQQQKMYEELKKTKEAEIEAGKESLATKNQQQATADKDLAQSKEDLEDTNNALNADQKYLTELKLKCQATDVEWEKRQKWRQDELRAVSEAIDMLSTDEARELFSKTFNPSFFQTTRVVQSKRRNAAALVLDKVGKKLNKPMMVEMATALRLDSFTRVKKAIDDMVNQLLKEKADEIKHRDYCIGGLNDNELETQSAEGDKKDAETKIEDLTMSIDTLDKEIETLKAEIKDLNAQLKQALADREKENADFEATIADQRATQKLLGQALEVLKSAYDKKMAMLAARKTLKKVGPPPPPGFETYAKNEQSGGVMAMIQSIINDAKALEKQAIKDEEKAQTAYGKFVTETNDAIDEKNIGITNKSKAKAEAEVRRTATEEARDELATQLEGLSNSKNDLHGECDYILKNFEARQAARDQEIDALGQAKAILSGAKY